MMKTINDTLTNNEYNGIISLLRQHTHKDNITIKDNIPGEYGNYQFTLEGVTLLDNGILITDETITAQPKVKLTNPVFTEATYTLKLEVLHYTNVDLLDTHTNYKVIDTLEIPLTPGTNTNIPVNRLDDGYIISFNAVVLINHNKTVTQGTYINTLTFTANRTVITTSETATLTITATDLNDIPVPNKQIRLYKNNTLYDTLTTNTQGQATKTITGTSTGGKQTFTTKPYGTSQTPIIIEDCIYYDLGDDDTTNNYWFNSNATDLYFDNDKMIIEAKTSSPQIQQRDLTNDVVGKRITYKVDLELNGIETRIAILKDGSTSAGAATQYISTDGTFEIKDYTVEAGHTYYFAIQPHNTSAGDKISFSNLKIYES